MSVNGSLEGGIVHIYIDGDACPVKQEVYRVAGRHELPVTLVANTWMRVPASPRITLEVVPDAFDAADDWIVEHVAGGDIVITADILLANRCLQNGARVLGSSGRPFTVENIGQALATRELMADLRGAGAQGTGPPPLTPRDRSRFLQELEQAIQANLRTRPRVGGPGENT